MSQNLIKNNNNRWSVDYDVWHIVRDKLLYTFCMLCVLEVSINILRQADNIFV